MANLSVTQAMRVYAVTASQLVWSGPGNCNGIFVSQIGADPKLAVYDGVDDAPGGLVIHPFVPAAGEFLWFPFHYDIGLYVRVGGQVKCSVFCGA